MSRLKLSDFKPIEIGDRNLIDEKFKKYQPEASEYCFAYLLAWQANFGFRWTLYKDYLLILCNPDDQNLYFLQPIGSSDRTNITLELLKWLKNKQNISHPYIDRADERLRTEVKEATNLTITQDRDYYDYIYTSQDLINLKGRKYHSKRNHIHNFKRQHSYKYERVHQDNIIECKNIAEKWCKIKDCEGNKGLQAEKKALFKILDNYEKLDMEGGLISVDGSYEAFTIGEKLMDNMAVVHYEKADPNIQGLYQIINQQYCKAEWDKVGYINREQDMGIRGIRKAKKSYHPEYFVKKYKITL